LATVSGFGYQEKNSGDLFFYLSPVSYLCYVNHQIKNYEKIIRSFIRTCRSAIMQKK